MEEAKSYACDYTVTQSDDAAVQTLIKYNATDIKTMPPEDFEKVAYPLKAGFAGYPVVGDDDHIAGLFADLSETSVDGFLLTWRIMKAAMPKHGIARPRRRLSALCRAEPLHRWRRRSGSATSCSCRA